MSPSRLRCVYPNTMQYHQGIPKESHYQSNKLQLCTSIKHSSTENRPSRRLGFCQTPNLSITLNISVPGMNTHLSLHDISRAFFIKDAGIQTLGGGLELWHGYFNNSQLENSTVSKDCLPLTSTGTDNSITADQRSALDYLNSPFLQDAGITVTPKPISVTSLLSWGILNYTRVTNAINRTHASKSGFVG
ncbi:hypothetical protein DFJ58DRAFT_843265 [Suillus subalutaceus]|uniref:uncharacterized protein n=1 Tax=Suillus subalutaceus TaxID=48586 RepID=UPI001B8833B3|nr:uncharacterized protein DFJ58DRAFT_843265 [Suillus subalutaceus]KAG1847175.1 hypothetical protein DFJ58DRAFT_843265 [Suillus subalutaceus]